MFHAVYLWYCSLRPQGIHVYAPLESNCFHTQYMIQSSATLKEVLKSKDSKMIYKLHRTNWKIVKKALTATYIPFNIQVITIPNFLSYTALLACTKLFCYIAMWGMAHSACTSMAHQAFSMTWIPFNYVYKPNYQRSISLTIWMLRVCVHNKMVSRCSK